MASNTLQSEPRPQRQTLRNGALAAVALAIAGTSLWLAFAPQRPALEPVEPEAAETAAPPATTTPEVRPTQKTAKPAPSAAAVDSHQPQPGDPSHPITAEHLRLYRENKMIHTIDNAILVKDYEAVRRLNAEYKREFPADNHALQDAYEMIADCLEEKTPERVARARKFWETRRSSQARRDLRHTCLE